VLFNSFPGMGAWNFTIRKAGFAVANEMILSGTPVHGGAACIACGSSTWSSTTAPANRPSSGRFERFTLAARHPGRAARTQPRRADHLSVADGHRRQVDDQLPEPHRARHQADGAAGASAGPQGGRANAGAVDEIKRFELDRAWDEERTGITEWSSL
jgi:DSF synthase